MYRERDKNYNALFRTLTLRGVNLDTRGIYLRPRHPICAVHPIKFDGQSSHSEARQKK